jgi:biotin synthase-related radical SAM superfamily protein
MPAEELPKKVRVSVGSAIVLGLLTGRLDALPTTVYMLTYKRGKCSASCAFCPQSKTSSGRADMLSRVIWPAFPTTEVMAQIATNFKKDRILRVCIQALNYANVQRDLTFLAKKVRASCEIPISVSCQPLTRRKMQVLVEAGVNRVSIALDAVNENLFDRVKGAYLGGPYSWRSHLASLKEAVKIFGRNNVSTHLIAGLGEREEDFVRTIQKCVDMGVYPAVFAFTPVLGTIMENNPSPSVDCYRRLQLAQYLITHGLSCCQKMTFEKGHLLDFGLQKAELTRIVERGEPFRTSGCPGCNRPYYNERPSGPIYNYPRELTRSEVAEIEKVLCL